MLDEYTVRPDQMPALRRGPLADLRVTEAFALEGAIAFGVEPNPHAPPRDLGRGTGIVARQCPDAADRELCLLVAAQETITVGGPGRERSGEAAGVDGIA